MQRLEMSLGLRIRSRVNWVQNTTKIDEHFFLYHLLTTWYPFNSLKLSRLYLRYMLHLIITYTRTENMPVKVKGRLSANESMKCLRCNVCKYRTSPTIHEQWHEISNNVICATRKGSDHPAHTRILIRALAGRLNILWLLSYWLNISKSL